MKNIPGPLPISGSAPKVNGVYSGLRSVLNPSYGKCGESILCNPGDKPTNKWSQAGNSLCGGDNNNNKKRKVIHDYMNSVQCGLFLMRA